MYPIPEHKTWHIIDPSSISIYQECPRKYFFRKILGYQSDQPNIHLVFGRALHEGFEQLRTLGYTEEGITAAVQVFNRVYRQSFGEATDMDYAPKNPATFARLIIQYVAKYAVTDSRLELIQQEKVIPVLIAEDTTIHCKLDAVYRDANDKYIALDPKTTGRKMSYWADQWLQRFQFKAYLHVLYSYFGYENVRGLIVDGIFLYKTRTEFERVTVTQTAAQMKLWLAQANRIMANIKQDMQMLAETTVTDEVMEAFPQCDTGCISYNRLCPFFNVCRARPNPLNGYKRVPEGMEVKFWNPYDPD